MNAMVSQLSGAAFVAPHIDMPALLSFWRDAAAASDPRLNDPIVLDQLREAAREARPLSHEICAYLRCCQGGVADDAFQDRTKKIVETLAMDLVASALFLDGLAGDPTAQATIDHLRRQRQLASLDWSESPLAMRGQSRSPLDEAVAMAGPL